MFKQICICDRCGKTAEDPVALSFRAMEADTGDLMDKAFELDQVELCEECARITYAYTLGKRAMPTKEEEAAGSPENKKTGRKLAIDIGKIKALRTAGWPIKEIAAEMNLKTSQVSNALYLDKKKHEKQEGKENG